MSFSIFWFECSVISEWSKAAPRPSVVLGPFECSVISEWSKAKAPTFNILTRLFECSVISEWSKAELGDGKVKFIV